ncbi:hypothetical protein RFI_08778 [Reticulomyxa filosa]|uniref:N-acetyltransferase domain-containing protein n=1 Tax=Reticulomyxa filosa TaxID=46433 RepID=X6NRK5_RETFI|nr:hypothetical protein RFI_08778 [Reticulomyxa filosa]|eukprot:ETO28354.1 hypothetical protein RFI_08778 [Reticulomyxa filosa]
MSKETLSEPKVETQTESKTAESQARKEENKSEEKKESEAVNPLEISQAIEDDIILYRVYKGEEDMHLIQELCAANLSEPYSVFTYRYFVNNWPKLTYFAVSTKVNKCVGLIICRLRERRNIKSGYIAMLVVDKAHRKKGIGNKLVTLCVDAMKADNAYEIVLETEIDNWNALKLYEKLGFVRSRKFRCYYMNGNDAYRLVLNLQMPLPLDPLL